jgi:hypothetical protein
MRYKSARKSFNALLLSLRTSMPQDKAVVNLLDRDWISQAPSVTVGIAQTRCTKH